jgi:glycosyltransferase involved in cell wall biosynthesis
LNWSCLIATHGDDAWSELAWTRAYPSAESQGFDEVIVEHHPEATLAQARNRALASADCDFVVFVDADDELEAGYLDAVKREVASGKTLSVMGGSDIPIDTVLLAPAVRYVHARGVSDARIPNRGRWPQLNECVIGTAAPRRLLLELGGFEEWNAWEDWALWLKCVAAGARLVHVDDAVYRAHVSANGRNRVVAGAELHASIVAAHREWAAREGLVSLL